MAYTEASIQKSHSPLETASMKIQFEAGNGVNFLRGETQHFSVYAECEVPEGASEDYGYLTMKRAIIAALPEGEQANFWYDGQEQFLAEDANVDCKVYTDIEEV